MTAFKIGDIVKVTGDTSRAGHDFEAGTIARVIELPNFSSPHDTLYGCEYLDRHDYWYVAVEDLELAIIEIDSPEVSTEVDMVNHPPHYNNHPSGVECIQITEHMSFTLGNAMKYIWRADLKNDAIEDLKKSVFYIEREIAKREAALV